MIKASHTDIIVYYNTIQTHHYPVTSPPSWEVDGSPFYSISVLHGSPDHTASCHSLDIENSKEKEVERVLVSSDKVLFIQNDHL